LRFGSQELLIVLLIVVLIFGARKLPDLARSLGASAKEFRKGVEEGTETESDTQTPDSPPPSDS
jgi:sec-independent protein translocase protein TatA